AVPVAVLPSGNVTVTVEPGSAVPPIVVSSLVTSFTVGASGAVVSLTVVVASSDLLPSLSVATTLIGSPPSNSTSGRFLLVWLSSHPAVPVAVVPSGNVTVTVEPGSAVPLTVVASLVTSFTVGASGAVVSLTVVVASSDLLPSLSAATTLIGSPPSNLTSDGISTV